MFYNLDKIEDMHPLFQALENCRGVTQMDIHHPEGDVFVHSVQVLRKALRESTDIDLIFAAMLHDIGKSVNSLGHEQITCKMLNGFISPKTEWLILNHMRIWNFILGEMKKRSKVMELYEHEWLPDLIMLARWDKMGRVPSWIPKYDRTDIIERLKGLL